MRRRTVRTAAAGAVLCLAVALGSGLTACKSGTTAWSIPVPPTPGPVPPPVSTSAAPDGTGATTGRTITVCQPPGTHPRFIAILVQGIGSKVQNGEPDGQSDRPFNPAQVSYCASPAAGPMPPNNDNGYIKSMAYGWLNWPNTDSATVSSGNSCGASSAGEERKGQNCNLVDALAMAGGYVLPFSYSPSYSYDGPSAHSYSGASSHGPVGAVMTGTSANPQFSFASYGAMTVANANPTMFHDVPGTGVLEPVLLQNEIASIHNVFRQTPIIVIGHSNGGLIAEQWWLNFGHKNPLGVIHVVSLDSPLNGIAEGTVGNPNSTLYKILNSATKGKYETLSNLLLLTGNLAPATLTAYDELWRIKDSQDALAITLDRNQSLFTPIGSYGDPLYDMSNFLADANDIRLNPGVPGAGIMSQLFFSQQCLTHNGISGSGPNHTFDVTKQDCQPVTPDFTSPCADNWYHGEDYDTDPGYFADNHFIGPTYNFMLFHPSTTFMHSLVKNCPGVIRKIMSFLPNSAAN